MSEKQIKFHLTDGKSDNYRIKQTGDDFQVWERIYGIMSSDKFLGKAKKFDDALAIARANVSGSIKSVEIS